MREILFRGKTKIQNEQKTSEWVFGGIVHQTDFYGNAVDRWFVIDGTSTLDYDMGENIEVDKGTICQYSELTDKNKAKIFENDIIKDIDSGDIGIVKFGIYDEKHYGFYIEWVTNSELREDIYFWTTKRLIEVVGNVFDNPELLKGADSN